MVRRAQHSDDINVMIMSARLRLYPRESKKTINLNVALLGTLDNITYEQYTFITNYFMKKSIKVVSFGNNIGADENFHYICHTQKYAYILGFSIHIYPDINPSYNAPLKFAHATVRPKPFIERYTSIVDASDVLIVCLSGANKSSYPFSDKDLNFVYDRARYLQIDLHIL